MKHQEFEPPEELKDSIKCFWHNTRDFEESKSDFEVQPDGYAEIIFYFGSALTISNDGNWQPLPSPFLIGLLNQPAIFHAASHLEVIGIRCFPWTVFDLLGLPSGKDGVRIFDHPIAQLQSDLNECIQANKIDVALDHIKNYFLKAKSATTDSMLFKAGNAIRKANGKMPVSEVAAAAHATVRSLERNFKESSGHTVKDVSALIRFEQARNQLWLHPDTNLAGLAHELGYADQSHLTKEFKRYSGTTPAAFARKAKNKNNT